ncbi:MAG: hypothetical protein JW717_03365 [Marinilabiliaceae bacterium]|nr:hypothetical protein [Marinilabiliaceae bacterium]
MNFRAFIFLFYYCISIYPCINAGSIVNNDSLSAIEIMALYTNEISVKYNPDSTTDYSCVQYQKIFFETSDSGISSPFLLIESLLEKKHKRPNNTKIRMVSNNIVGKSDPTLIILASQLDPFLIYKNKIRLWTLLLHNPLSGSGMNFYDYYIIENSIDSIVKIGFKPKYSGIGFYGYCNISDGSLLNYEMTVSSEDTRFNITIRQSFCIIDDKHWFPDKMNALIKIIPENDITSPIKAEMKSSFTAVNLNAFFLPDEFDKTLVGADQVMSKHNDSLRAMIMLDSINRANSDEQLINFQKKVIEGQMPIGPVNLDFTKFIDYNDFEGFKLGMGVWTNKRISQVWSTGGYYVRSFGNNNNKYGAGVKVNLHKESDTRMSVMWQDDYLETGIITFFDGFERFSQESFRRFLTESMDRTESFSFDIRSKVTKNITTAFAFNYRDVAPELSYRFFTDHTQMEERYTLYKGSVRGKWHIDRDEKVFAIPTIWVNASLGEGNQSSGSFSYNEFETQIEENIHVTPSNITILRLVAGYITGSFPSSCLFSAFGSYKKVGIEIPYTFATMRLNEFAADKFYSLHLSHDIDLFHQSPGRFKPHLLLTTNYGQGLITSKQYKNSVVDFSKGYLESGLIVNSLLHNYIIDYGFAVHYRYGPYQLDNDIDNWAFMVSVIYNL